MFVPERLATVPVSAPGVCWHDSHYWEVGTFLIAWTLLSKPLKAGLTLRLFPQARGFHPGWQWIREESSSGFHWVLKNDVHRSQEAGRGDNNGPLQPHCTSTTFHHYSPKHAIFYPHSLSWNPSSLPHCSFCNDLSFLLGPPHFDKTLAQNNYSQLLPTVQFSFLYALFLPMIFMFQVYLD